MEFLNDSPGLADVPGFLVAGVSCDVRGLGNGRIDTALIVSETPCSAAATFTTNVVKAAPVRLGLALLAAARPVRGIIANSGNANACTGDQGLADAREMLALAARAAGRGATAEDFFIGQTGRIGRAMPMDRVRAGLPALGPKLGRDPQAGREAASAILTSDTKPKSVTARFTHGGKTFTLAGIAKGAGMIQPNMATMLAFLGTDLAVPRKLLQTLLTEAVGYSFNAITVDGDMSTNDTVILLANGASGVAADSSPELLEKFREALRAVCQELADKIVSDGERVSKIVEVRIEGAATAKEANAVARAIGNSLLVKTSWFGHDPNWGRLMDAAGYAGVAFEEEQVDLFYAPYTHPAPGSFAAPEVSGLVPALIKGKPQDANLPQWKAIAKERRFTIVMNLGMGGASYRLLANDLSTGYVDFNKSE